MLSSVLFHHFVGYIAGIAQGRIASRLAVRAATATAPAVAHHAVGAGTGSRVGGYGLFDDLLADFVIRWGGRGQERGCAQ